MIIILCLSIILIFKIDLVLMRKKNPSLSKRSDHLSYYHRHARDENDDVVMDVEVMEEGGADHESRAGDDGVEGGVIRVGVELPLKGSLGEEELTVLLRLGGHHVGHDQHHHGEQVEPLVVLPLFQHGLKAVRHVLRRD